MADPLGGVVGKVTDATQPITSAANPLGQVGATVGGALTGAIGKIVSSIMAFVDKWFPPEKRAEWTARLKKFANERPTLAAFLLSHIAISGVPLALFIIMTITVATFAIIVALLVALLGAVLFILFAVGVALAFLLPTLFFTTLVATFVFLWGLGAYYIVKWFNEKKIPGIHTDLVGGLKDEFMQMTEPDELDKLPHLKKAAEAPTHPSPQQQHQSAEESSDDPEQKEKPRQRQTQQQRQQKPNQNGSAKPKKLPPHDNKQQGAGALDSVGKTTGIDAGGVGKTVNGVKQAVPGGVL